MTPEPLPSSLRARVLAEAHREPSATRSERLRRVLAAAIGGACFVVVLALSLGVRGVRPPLALLALALGGGALALVVTWGAASRGRSMLGRSRGSLAGVAVLAVAGPLAWPLAVGGVQGTVPLMGGTPAQHVICFVLTSLVALAPFAAITYARRGSDPVHPRALGAAIGAAAGAWGGALIDVHCSLVTFEHLAVGHAAPIALFALVGALVGGRVFGVRGSPG
jgi:hypothetical protein